ncbi:HD domain-containing protein [Caulifigura coniformis]|nr:HD domain-containing protein [Caulifigura coniformis]
MERAWRVAAIAHAGQHRKATEIPYLVHPAAVALILQRSGFADEHLLAAAVLHDVVEDTDWTLERLADQFPPDVLEIVDVLTEKKHDEQGVKRPWAKRKAEKLERISKSSIGSRAVWLADKRHNLETMAFDHIDDPDFWSRFNAPKESLLKSYRDGVEAARHGDPRLEHLAEECLELLAKLEEQS